MGIQGIQGIGTQAYITGQKFDRSKVFVDTYYKFVQPKKEKQIPDHIKKPAETFAEEVSKLERKLAQTVCSVLDMGIENNNGNKKPLYKILAQNPPDADKFGYFLDQIRNYIRSGKISEKNIQDAYNFCIGK